MIIGSPALNRPLGKGDGGEDVSHDTEIDNTNLSDKHVLPDHSLIQDINSSPKSSKMKHFPQMLLSDSKLKRSKLMTRRESQALLEGVRKNRGVQSTQSCNN